MCLGTAQADVIIFKSGSAKIGIIEEETPTQVKIRVKDIVVGISRSNIEKIEHSTQAENEKLMTKWKEEKEQLDEERKQKREAEDKFEAEQKKQGLIEVDGEWMSPGEAEARRQQQILQQVESKQEQKSAPEETPAAENLDLPENFDDLSDEAKQLVMEDAKRRQQIEVGQVTVFTLSGGTQAGAKGTVTNGSDITAKSITIEIQCFDENGNPLGTRTTTVTTLKPGETGSFNTPLRIPAALIKTTSVRVPEVNWKQ